MVEEAKVEITNDAYLTIIYGAEKDEVQMPPYDIKQSLATKNLLDGVLGKTKISKSGIATVALAGLTSKIGQNLAGKALSSATLGRINSSIYDIMSDGQINIKEVAEDFVGSCTNAIDNIATDMGFPTPSSLYTALMPGGTGVISKDFSNLLAKKMDKENKDKKEKANTYNVTMLKFKIITNDTETWGMDIPTRKTESGFEIATAISNHNKIKDFEVLLANNTKKGTNMYQLKRQLEELRNLKIPFDVYINDKDVYEQYKLTNCLFSNLDFTPSGRNALQCNMSIIEIPEWDVQIVKLDSTYKGKSTNGETSGGSANKSGTGGSANKSGTGGSNKSPEAHAKTSNTKLKNIGTTVRFNEVNDETCWQYVQLGYSNEEILEKFIHQGIPGLKKAPNPNAEIQRLINHSVSKYDTSHKFSDRIRSVN